MATKQDEFKTYVVSLTESELDIIICSLYEAGEDQLADGLEGVLSKKTVDIATLTIDNDASNAKRQVDELQESANKACEAMERLRGYW